MKNKTEQLLCPFCQKFTVSRILEIRDSLGYSLRRRRECLTCQTRFTTYERIAPFYMPFGQFDGNNSLLEMID
jgi:transcriptional repressor NrdR